MVFEDYAQEYDIFYKNKNYRQECRYLEKIFRVCSSSKPKTILDLGCGTGNYLIPLLKTGYQVTGLDSSPKMLRFCRDKIDRHGLKAALYKGKLQSFRLNKKFDAVICMFSVIDYVTKIAEVKRTLKNVFNHLKSGGLFIFDFWQESAVRDFYTASKKRTFTHNGRSIERQSKTRLFPSQKICKVYYTCRVKQGKKLLKKYEEAHTLRYFSVEEMKSYLWETGFQVKDVHPFFHLKGIIRKNTWDVTMVAQK